jgi:hypothetical protein
MASNENALGNDAEANSLRLSSIQKTRLKDFMAAASPKKQSWSDKPLPGKYQESDRVHFKNIDLALMVRANTLISRVENGSFTTNLADSAKH